MSDGETFPEAMCNDLKSVYIDTWKPAKPGFECVQRRCFNLYWMTNQPHITRGVLTGNQCIQPPILHQYSVSACSSCSLSSHAFSFFLSLSLLGRSLLLFRKHFYFKEIFVSALCWNEAALRMSGMIVYEGERGVCFWESDFSSNGSCWGDDSWRRMSLIPSAWVTGSLGSITLKSNENYLGGQWRKKQ